ncbi:WLM domain-containing protein [Aspergillus karnatakaensis]|uniref:metalloendopeptidase WSS1 n=1 Tax=Aspergillus karnatakaensis TaxID=1810916 RepID=UPI003CCD4D34
MRELDPLVGEYQHDRHRPRESEALLILRKIASLVKPIMRRRSWRVGTLCEFYPHQRNLLGLNVNGGQKICLRLRYPSDQNQFLPIDQVLDTMLHELCHNVHGPHNQQFHALWNQLRDEHAELSIKGYTGEGFLSHGRRLGGQKVPIDEARRQARAAAERRQTLYAGSGQKVGGTGPSRGAAMRRAIADAAQRRIDVTTGCASGANNSNELAEEASRNGFRTKAEEDDANEQAIMQAYIDLIEEEEREKYGPSYIPPSQENPAGPRTNLSPPPVPEHTRPSVLVQQENEVDLTVDDSNYAKSWSCPTCTLVNPSNFLCCDACASERPRPVNSRSVSGPPSTANPTTTAVTQSKNKGTINRTVGQRSFKNRRTAVESLSSLEKNAQKRPLGWLCTSCGAFMETEWWTCSGCGTMKQVS